MRSCGLKTPMSGVDASAVSSACSEVKRTFPLTNNFGPTFMTSPPLLGVFIKGPRPNV